MHTFVVSVVIPVYRAEKYVSEAVESALRQPETGEIILIEDGSPDKSLVVCTQLEQQHSAVRLVRHPDGRNRGASASRNLGIRSASHPYVAFLDADDFYLPNRFSRTAEVFASNARVDGVYEAIGTTFADDEAKELWSRLPFRQLTTVTSPIAPHDLFLKLISGKHGYFSFDGFTGRRGLFSGDCYFNEQLRMSEDTELMYKLSARARLLPGSIDIPVAMRRVHGGNRITHHLDNKRDAYDSLASVWESLLSWEVHNLTTEQRKQLLHRYISHLRKIDFFIDFRWNDYLMSRLRIFRLARQYPKLLADSFFWRRVLPSRNLLKVAKHD